MTQPSFNNPGLIIEEMSLLGRAFQNSSGEQVLWMFLNTVSAHSLKFLTQSSPDDRAHVLDHVTE